MNVFAIRHGKTAWSLSGQHTGTTDIPLTDNGRRHAERMRSVLAAKAFALVLCSPMQRARETCELAGLGDRAIIDPDLVEWNYGEYEGLIPKRVREVALFAHGHVLRVFVARWIGLPARGGQHFLLNTGTLCVLGYYRAIPAVRIWNGPLLD